MVTKPRLESIIQYQTLLRESPDGVLIVGPDGEILFANPAATSAFGVGTGELLGTLFGVPVVGDILTEIELRSGRTMEMRVAPIPWQRQAAYLVLLRDVTDRVRALAELARSNRQLEELALVDPLTGVLNRRGIEAELLEVVGGLGRAGGHAAAILIDCDDFKGINEVAGHSAGDATLRTIATALVRALRSPVDRIGRIGGDEFLVLLPNTTLAEGFLVATKLRNTIHSTPLPVSVPGIRAEVTVSLGLTAIPPFAASLKEVLAGAESALIASKRAGKDRVTAHGVDLPLHPVGSDVREILSDPQAIRVMAQRIVGPSGATGVVHEFLVRGPKNTPLEHPAALFSAARHANVLCAADLLCLRRCIEATQYLTGDDCVHVNIFPSTFLDTPARALRDILVQSGGPRVALELSEQELIGAPAMLLPSLRAMKDAGVLIALDDVGFGRSSLETLVVLEPDIVKIDRSVVHGVAEDPGRRRILERLLGCLMPLGPQIIAEGVETEADARVVADLGVQFAQGYLLGAVVAVGDTGEWARC